MKTDEITHAYWKKALFLLALLSLVAGGTWFYKAQEQVMHEKAEENLTA